MAIVGHGLTTSNITKGNFTIQWALYASIIMPPYNMIPRILKHVSGILDMTTHNGHGSPMIFLLQRSLDIKSYLNLTAPTAPGSAGGVRPGARRGRRRQASPAGC